MSKWWHTLASIGMAAISIVVPQVQGVVSHHAGWAAGLGFAWAILGHLLPSPVADQVK